MIDPILSVVASNVKYKINEFCMTFDGGFRTHLGASIIGDKCKRKLWFTFRWIYHAIPDGKQARIFDTGHHEELRMIEWLKGAGYNIKTIDPKTEKQFHISSIEGHFGGSLDGICFIPAMCQSVLVEFKTNKTGSEFNKLVENGVQETKEKHWAQVCTYGFKYHLDNVLYICKNKDNDELHVEIAKLDHNLGQQMENKAREIIYSKTMPVRISESPAYFECKFCEFVDVCHKFEPAMHNCRSCKQAESVENGEWKCNKWNAIIPKEEIVKDQACWESII